MDEKKQIEEMAKVIKSSLEGLGSGNFNFTGDEFSTMVAKKLYNANYRKQSEGEWHTVIDNKNDIVTECTACKKLFWFMKKGQLNIDQMPYCPNCGAKMKGGAE